MYCIYELTPAPWGDDFRYVARFDTYEDAKKVWDCLESVNVLMSCYKIINMTKPYEYYLKKMIGRGNERSVGKCFGNFILYIYSLVDIQLIKTYC